MNVSEIIHRRRAYRSLVPVKISEKTIKDLAEHASLAPSCFNKQSWRFVFVIDADTLKAMSEAMSKGNEWTQLSSMIIAVFSRQDHDCELKGREYFLFDTGIATAFLILRATELGLVSHPIAGYNEQKIKEILKIPESMTLITLVCVGKKSNKDHPILNEKQIEVEKQRPRRFPFKSFAYINTYTPD